MNIGIERVFQHQDMITGIYVLIFGLITLIKFLYPKRFTALSNCLISKSYFLDYANELSESFSMFHVLLFVVQNLIFTILFYNYFFFEEVSHLFGADWLGALRIFTGLSLYFIFQLVFGKTASIIFRFEELYTAIRVYKFSYLKVAAFALLPVLLLQNYAFQENRDALVMGTAFVFVSVLFLRVILIVVKNNKLIIERLFYFILYLCTLEIAPLLIIYKLTTVN